MRHKRSKSVALRRLSVREFRHWRAGRNHGAPARRIRTSPRTQFAATPRSPASAVLGNLKTTQTSTQTPGHGPRCVHREQVGCVLGG